MSSLLLSLPKLARLSVAPSIPSRGIRTRARGGRSSNHASSQILLDKFVKHTRQDGSVSVRAPFHLKIRGSFFDEDNNVDRERNRRIAAFHLRQQQESRREADRQSSDASREALVKDAEEEAKIVDKPARRDSLWSEEVLGEKKVKKAWTSPMHLLLYGRLLHRVDSYSIMEPQVQTSHLYITDSANEMEMESLFINHHYMENSSLNSLKPNCVASISQPKHAFHVANQAPTVMEGDYEVVKGQMASAFRIYCPPLILANPDHGIKAVFLVPTVMESISMHGERDGNVELDGQLVSGLKLVNLNSESGHVKLRDVFSKDIRITTKGGDVESEGLLEGNVMVDVKGEGDFIAKYIEGPAIVARTEMGDINVLGDCHSDMSHFAANTGSVYVRYLYGNSYILIHKVGFLTFNLVEGTATAIVNQGGAFVSFENVTSDSNVQVCEGDMTVTIPSKHNFRIDVTAAQTNIEPKLLNSGEFFLHENGQLERFHCGCCRGNSDSSIPVLTLEAPKGRVTLQFSDSDKGYMGGYDSTS